jgi:hypothetical protein
MLAAQLRDWAAGLGLLEDGDDLTDLKSDVFTQNFLDPIRRKFYF